MKVILLGAGASAATLGCENAPISRQFGKVLCEKLPVWSQRYPFLRSAIQYLSLQSGVEKENWALDAVWDGIDENFKLRRVIRHHDLPTPAGPVPEERLYSQYPDRSSWDSFWTLAGWELKRALTFVYGDGLRSLLEPARLSSKWLADRFQELGPNGVIVSMNYDLLAEGLARFHWPGAGNCRNKADDRQRRRNENSWPLILKPHGSLDWVFMTNWLTNRHLLERTESGVSLQEADIDLGEDFWERRPVVVAPVRYKDEILVQRMQPAELTEVLNFQWQSFITALSKAEELRVFGYGFPPDDSYGNRMLQEAMRRRSGGSKLHVFLHLPDEPPDYICSETRRRIEKNIFRADRAAVECCDPIPC